MMVALFRKELREVRWKLIVGAGIAVLTGVFLPYGFDIIKGSAQLFGEIEIRGCLVFNEKWRHRRLTIDCIYGPSGMARTSLSIFGSCSYNWGASLLERRPRAPFSSCSRSRF